MDLPDFPRTNSRRCVSGSILTACCSRSRCSARRCAAGNGTQPANWRRIVRNLREEMKTNKTGTLLNWASIVLLTLGTALPATFAAQDADAKEDKEKAKIQREEEREAERLYQQARKLADKGQWETALKAFDEASQKGGS